eukprot:3730447-Rhodomonas_salina.1
MPRPSSAKRLEPLRQPGSVCCADDTWDGVHTFRLRSLLAKLVAVFFSSALLSACLTLVLLGVSCRGA